MTFQREPENAEIELEAKPTSHNPAPSISHALRPDSIIEQARTPKPSPFSSSFHEAFFILVIGLSQLFSVGGLGNTAFAIQQISQSLHTTSNGQTS
jgi:hypothetical protein